MATSEKEKCKKQFFDESEDEDKFDATEKIRINKKFATAYQHRKQKAELRRVQLDEDDDSSSGSSEDEEARLLTVSLDVDIIKTIHALREKDKRIYNPDVRFFEDNNEDDGDSANSSSVSSSDKERSINSNKKKAKRYKDIEREQILKQMGDSSDHESTQSEAECVDGAMEQDSKFAYDKEQQKLRKIFLESAAGSDELNEQSGDDSEGLLIVKNKKRATEDSQIQKQLEREIEKLKASSSSAGAKLIDPRGEVKDGESFLLDFFKNRAWVHKDNDDADINSDNDSRDDNDGSGKDANDDDASLDDLEKADDFEATYNFRFEKASDGAKSGVDFSNVSYARGQTMSTLRRNDESRRGKRLARKERKALERQAKEEQLRRLKNAKRQELDEKLKHVKAVLGELGSNETTGGGVDEVALLKLLEGDFEPDKFEALMKETYGDGFYQQPDAQWKNDQDVRSSLKEDEDGALIVGLDGKDGDQYDYDLADQEDEDEDTGDKDGNEEDEWAEQKEEYYEEAQETTLEQRVQEKMMDELYKLDYEDIVAGMPTRFKYRKVEPNSYGLTTEEILFARDSTLKQFVSLKNMAPYQEGGEYFVGSKRRRRFRELLKRDLEEAALNAGAKEEESSKVKSEEVLETAADVNSKKKRRRKRGKRKSESTNDDPDLLHSNHSDVFKASVHKELQQRSNIEAEQKQNAHDAQNNQDDAVCVSEPRAKRRRKKGNVQSTESSLPNDNTETSNVSGGSTETKEWKKKKKVKKDKSKTKTLYKNGNAIDGVSESRLASYGL
jgi:protein KRI1